MTKDADVDEDVADAVELRQLTAKLLVRTDSTVEEDVANAFGVEMKAF